MDVLSTWLLPCLIPALGPPQPAVLISALTNGMSLIIYTANPLQSKPKQQYFHVSSLTSKKARINLCEIQLWRDLLWGKKK